MVDAVEGGGPLGGVEGKHRQQPPRELLRGLHVPLVLVGQHLQYFIVMVKIKNKHVQSI